MSTGVRAVPGLAEPDVYAPLNTEGKQN